MKTKLPYQNETAEAIKDFMNTINAVYMYYELDQDRPDNEPYPFYMWLEDVRQKLADLSNAFWKEFYYMEEKK